MPPKALLPNPCSNIEWRLRTQSEFLQSLNPCFNGRYSLSWAVRLLLLYWLWGLNPCFNGRYSLRINTLSFGNKLSVLILVLMEDTHWGSSRTEAWQLRKVLILVLMEDTHWVSRKMKKNKDLVGLNPCFNGRYSLSEESSRTRMVSRCLNPCFNGRYSLRRAAVWRCCGFASLNPCFNGRYSLSKGWWRVERCYPVLILVLMEDTHWGRRVRCQRI